MMKICINFAFMKYNVSLYKFFIVDKLSINFFNTIADFIPSIVIFLTIDCL